MDVLFYAICCLLMPLWIFSGLYLLVESVEMAREHYTKVKEIKAKVKK